MKSPLPARPFYVASVETVGDDVFEVRVAGNLDDVAVLLTTASAPDAYLAADRLNNEFVALQAKLLGLSFGAVL